MRGERGAPALREIVGRHISTRAPALREIVGGRIPTRALASFPLPRPVCRFKRFVFITVYPPQCTQPQDIKIYTAHNARGECGRLKVPCRTSVQGPLIQGLLEIKDTHCPRTLR